MLFFMLRDFFKIFNALLGFTILFTLSHAFAKKEHYHLEFYNLDYFVIFATISFFVLTIIAVKLPGLFPAAVGIVLTYIVTVLSHNAVRIIANTVSLKDECLHNFFLKVTRLWSSEELSEQMRVLILNSNLDKQPFFDWEEVHVLLKSCTTMADVRSSFAKLRDDVFARILQKQPSPGLWSQLSSSFDGLSATAQVCLTAAACVTVVCLVGCLFSFSYTTVTPADSVVNNVVQNTSDIAELTASVMRFERLSQLFTDVARHASSHDESLELLDSKILHVILKAHKAYTLSESTAMVLALGVDRAAVGAAVEQLPEVYQVLWNSILDDLRNRGFDL